MTLETCQRNWRSIRSLNRICFETVISRFQVGIPRKAKEPGLLSTPKIGSRKALNTATGSLNMLRPPFEFPLTATPCELLAVYPCVEFPPPTANALAAADAKTAPSSVPAKLQSASPKDWQSTPAPWVTLTARGRPLRAVKSGAIDQPPRSFPTTPCWFL